MTLGQIAQYQMRPLANSDLDEIAAWFEQVEDLALFSRRTPLPVNRNAMDGSWQATIEAGEPRSSYWFVIRSDSDELVGLTGIQDINYIHGDCVLPVFIAPSERHQGLGARAAALTLDLAFNQLRLVRVTSYYRADNRVSRNLCKHLGLTEEGCIRNAWFAQGRSMDMVVVGILADKWQQHRTELNGQLSFDKIIRMGSLDFGVYRWPYTENAISNPSATRC